MPPSSIYHVSPRPLHFLPVLLLSLLLASVGHSEPLIATKSCAALGYYFYRNAVRRVGPYGLGDPFPLYYRNIRPQPISLPRRRGPTTTTFDFASSSAPTSTLASTTASVPKSAAAPTSTSPPVEGVDFSGTNVQVSGVDEPDIIKTDGTNVYVIRGRVFYHVVKTGSGSGGKVVGKLSIPTTPNDILFDIGSDNIILISQTYQSPPPITVRPPPVPVPFFDGFDARGRRIRRPIRTIPYRPFIYRPQKPVTVLYRIFLKPYGKRPQLVDTTKIDGKYISARSVYGVGRLVIQYDASKYLPFVYPYIASFTRAAAIAYNKRIITSSKRSSWIPQYDSTGHYPCKAGERPTDSAGFCGTYSIKRKQLTECDNFYYPKGVFSGFSTLSVVTVPLAGPLIPSGVSIIADGETVYANADAMYVATTEYRWDFGTDTTDARRLGRGFHTSFHKFDLTGYVSAYVASGKVSGSVLNQFSMHEYKGAFFVATTDGASWWSGRDLSASKVTSFIVGYPSASSGTKALIVAGNVGGLGKGERIYAVRYIEDKAYIVTFRRVDPLYIVDLSDVYRLRVTGELKIPGYSAYLHPIGNGRLIGVGRDATDRGVVTGAKVSLFDVSDVRRPKELSTWTLKGSYTAAEWEHKAFLWWAPQRVAVLPVSVNSGNVGDRFTGAVVLHVTERRISERGRIEHSSISSSSRSLKRIERTFVLDRKHLWSLSRRLLQVNLIKTLAKESTIDLK